MRYCSIESCNKIHEARGYCKSHYKSLIKYGDPLQVDENKWIREEVRIIEEQMREDALKQGMEITTRGTTRKRAISRDGVCSVKNCGRPIKARYLCEKHYTRMRRYGSVQRTTPSFEGIDRCLAFGCENPYHGAGFCSTHKSYNQKFGTPYLPKVKRYCGVEGCINIHLAKGLCGKHYQRKEFEPLAPKTIEFCGVKGCNELHVSKGLCENHYSQWVILLEKRGMKGVNNNEEQEKVYRGNEKKGVRPDSPRYDTDQNVQGRYMQRGILR